MTKYRETTLSLAAMLCAAVLFTAGRAEAGLLDEAFAPRSVPGLELAKLDVPVVKAPPLAASAQPAAAPDAVLPAPEPVAEKGFWQRTKEFFGFK